MGTITELGIHLADLCVNLAEWSQATFGTDAERGPLGALKHLAKEAAEAQAAWIVSAGHADGTQAPNGAWIGPHSLHAHVTEEMADCLILVIDAARRAGIKPMQLVEAAEAKVRENRGREWPKPGVWIFETPHFVDSEDCMGHARQYWRCWAKRGDEVACGMGLTSEQAVADCQAKARLKGEPIEHVRKEGGGEH